MRVAFQDKNLIVYAKKQNDIFCFDLRNTISRKHERERRIK